MNRKCKAKTASQRVSKHIRSLQRKINNKKVSVLFQFLESALRVAIPRVAVMCFNTDFAGQTI